MAFNDPFDCQFACGFPFSVEEFEERFKNELETLVFQAEEPRGDNGDPLFKMILLTRRHLRGRGREQFRGFLEQSVSRLIPQLQAALAFAADTWSRQLSRLRIICLSETRDNLTMWAHYAARHTGAVIRIRCVKERDSVFLGALPVRYSDEAPFVGTLDQWIKHMTGQQRIDYDAHFLKLVTTKSRHWSYEREWRVIDPACEPYTGTPDFDQYWPEEIDEVYFGCRTDDANIDLIMSSVPQELEHVEFFKAGTMKWEFGLEFHKIGRNN